MFEEARADAACIPVAPVGPNAHPDNEQRVSDSVREDQDVDGLTILETACEQQCRSHNELQKTEEENHSVESNEGRCHVDCVHISGLLWVMATALSVAVESFRVNIRLHVGILKAEDEPEAYPTQCDTDLQNVEEKVLPLCF